MASSRGRERAREATRNFAFGSSTPREFSHLNKIPPKLRTYDVKVKKEYQGPALGEYMKKARSLSRNGKSAERQWVFGSSTPRDLSHLEKIQKNLRRYDAAPPKKSITTPSFVATSYKRTSTASTGPSSKQETPQRRITPKDDDISSEPDFVQDRKDFIEELRKTSVEQMAGKASKDPGTSNNVKKGEHGVDSTTFGKVPELFEEQRPSQRIPTDIHEDDAGQASHNEPVRLSDQITVHEMVEQKIIQPEDGFHGGQVDENLVNDVASKIEHAKIEEANLLDKTEALAHQ